MNGFTCNVLFFSLVALAIVRDAISSSRWASVCVCGEGGGRNDVKAAMFFVLFCAGNICSVNFTLCVCASACCVCCDQCSELNTLLAKGGRRLSLKKSHNAISYWAQQLTIYFCDLDEHHIIYWSFDVARVFGL